MRSTPDASRVVERSVRMIETIASSQRAPTLSEITRSSNLPKSSVHRLLQSLTELDLVTRYQSSYIPDLRLISLAGSLAPGPPRQSHVIKPPLVWLQHGTGLPTALVGLRGDTAVVVESVFAVGQEALSRVRGTACLARSTAAGVLLLGDIRSTAQTRSGLAWLDDGVRAEAAAPVYGRSLRPVAAVSVRWPSSAAVDRSWTDALRSASHAASRAVRRAQAGTV